MRNSRFISAIVLGLLITSCINQPYLSRIENVPSNPYGAYINIQKRNNFRVRGELLAIKSDTLILLDRKLAGKNRINKIVTNDIKSYRLKYANPVNYWWSVPVYTLASLSHGWFLILTLPVNLITTLTVAGTSSSSYGYTDRTLDIMELYKFTRFPQGIPPGVKLQEL